MGRARWPEADAQWLAEHPHGLPPASPYRPAYRQKILGGTKTFTKVSEPWKELSKEEVDAWRARNLAERWATSVERLRQLTGDQLTRRIDFRGIFNFPAVVYIQVGLNHSIHHRGQLSMYLRPMGAAVPSIYGESYDAREARERAAAIQQK